MNSVKHSKASSWYNRIYYKRRYNKEDDYVLLADQNVNYTIIPKEKMPEKFADTYVFYKRNGSDINDFTCIEQFVRKNYIQRDIMREISSINIIPM
ncbi:hypothetical protein [Ruminococcus flavefaciens]|uniref:hypothetical protein n=1 Tax=Ruminococcus flavefaciens TaxID=1265 RepID=UPI0026F174FD|nr:hypothetical protein [Ruminococcus flavefaciens]